VSPLKVFLVTGGYAGVGLEPVKILFQKNATVYVAGHSLEKGMHAIEGVQSATKSSTGKLQFLLFDLSDLSAIKKPREHFCLKKPNWTSSGITPEA
jgi:NAD(P)-dependent dehydrogenase (short-subunit alcohol dehydrogenase family)